MTKPPSGDVTIAPLDALLRASVESRSPAAFTALTPSASWLVKKSLNMMAKPPPGSAAMIGSPANG